jgi:hypothetical protein
MVDEKRLSQKLLGLLRPSDCVCRVQHSELRGHRARVADRLRPRMQACVQEQGEQRRTQKGCQTACRDPHYTKASHAAQPTYPSAPRQHVMTATLRSKHLPQAGLAWRRAGDGGLS